MSVLGDFCRRSLWIRNTHRATGRIKNDEDLPGNAVSNERFAGKDTTVGFFVHQSSAEMTINRSIDQVFAALVGIEKNVGKVKAQDRRTGCVTVRIPMRFFPPTNPATVRVRLKEAGKEQTAVSLDSDCFDGLIGFDSASQAIEKIVENLRRNL